nr:hypothetical protein CFP56_11757 [Quercus suber]
MDARPRIDHENAVDSQQEYQSARHSGNNMIRYACTVLWTVGTTSRPCMMSDKLPAGNDGGLFGYSGQLPRLYTAILKLSGFHHSLRSTATHKIQNSNSCLES